MPRYFDLKRLLFAMPVIATVVVAGYLLLGRDSDASASITPARLLDTPGAGSTRVAGLQQGNLAPDFEISTFGGQRLRLSDLRGRPVLINFWATWCASCLTEMPDIKAIQEEKGTDAFAVLAINAGESVPDARKFIDFIQAPFTFGLDPGLVISDAYGIYGLPVSLFVDSQGVVQAAYNGHALHPRLEAYIDAAIQASPPGAFPDSLRLLSTVMRDRVLQVTKRGTGSVEYTSRSLRCDNRYCANDAIAALKDAPGITSVRLDTKRAYPTLSLRYDSKATSEQAVTDAVVRALTAIDDPVYTTPLEVR